MGIGNLCVRARRIGLACAIGVGGMVLAAGKASAVPFVFNSGDPDGRMGMASRPGNASQIEIEAADDFLLPSDTQITGGTFTGLLTGGATVADVSQVVVEIYRVFPLDSNTVRTPNVPTRNNSPSDVAFDSRDSLTGMIVTSNVLSAQFNTLNSVLNGINKSPNQTTGGEGPVSGSEVRFSFTFNSALNLPAGHYFFVPQVLIDTNQIVASEVVTLAAPLGSQFYWLSSPKPITGPGTTPFLPDLQAWIRNDNIDPDWLRVGTDIVGGTTPPTFNASFSLDGQVAAIPLPPAVWTGLSGFAAVVAGAGARRFRRK